MRHGSFPLDVASSVPLLVLPFVSGGSKWLLLVLALRLARLLRVRRVINMLFYIQVRMLHLA